MTLTLYFSSAGYGECLLDKPVSLGYNRKMFRDYVTPGEAFDSSRQCSLVFGSGFAHMSLHGETFSVRSDRDHVSEIIVSFKTTNVLLLT